VLGRKRHRAVSAVSAIKVYRATLRVSPYYRFAVTNSVVHARNECCFGLPAWHFRIAYHHKPISWCSWSYHCGQNWSLNSPDLNPCDNILWGFLKEKTFPKKPQTLIELRAIIIQACNKITEDMYHWVINIIVRVEEAYRCKGGHVEHLIHRW
jgi:hypothetical protein